jgi:hypothetical protein
MPPLPSPCKPQPNALLTSISRSTTTGMLGKTLSYPNFQTARTCLESLRYARSGSGHLREGRRSLEETCRDDSGPRSQKREDGSERLIAGDHRLGSLTG